MSPKRRDHGIRGPITMYTSASGGQSGTSYNRIGLHLLTVEELTERLIGMGWVLMCVLSDGTAQLFRPSDNRMTILERPHAVA